MAPRLLFVEDDADIRETLADLLRDEGYDVHEAEDAEQGLRALAASHFDVLLSDYRLPDQTGTTMIAEAAQGGAVEHTAVLLLSASMHIEGASGLRVLKKPIDLDDLCREIEAALEAHDAPSTTQDDGLKLVLFVMRNTQSAERAEGILRPMLARRGLALCLELVDVATPEGSARAEQERVAFTPTLLRLFPLPRRRIVGDLRRRAAVERLLRESGAR
jgi:DNA-binding response OmpR family regulator